MRLAREKGRLTLCACALFPQAHTLPPSLHPSLPPPLPPSLPPPPPLCADASSKTSKCVIELQKKLPLARVVYASATGVTELGNLAYCERLGLWGQGGPFVDFEAFLKVVSRKGIFFLEMLAMELKREGAYVSRGLSFKRAEFETLTLALTPAQTAVYDKAASLWIDVRLELQKALALTNSSARLMSVLGCRVCRVEG